MSQTTNPDRGPSSEPALADPAPEEGERYLTPPLPAEGDDAPPAEGADAQGAAELAAATAPAPEPVEAGPTLADINELLKKMQTAIDGFNARAEFHEGQLRQLQARAESLQGNQTQELLMPALRSLAKLHTQAALSAEEARENPEGFEAGVEFEFFAAQISEALAILGMQLIEPKPETLFDRSLHASQRVVNTDDPALDGTIATVFRQGLLREGAERSFLPAQVSVYRATQAAPRQPDPGSAGEPTPQTTPAPQTAAEPEDPTS